MEKPRVMIMQAVLTQILSEGRQSFVQGVETGGFLAGTLNKGTVTVEGFVGPGPESTRTAAKFEPDYVYCAQRLSELKEQRGLQLIGGWHVHSGFLDSLSSGDLQTLRALRRDYPEFVAMLVSFGQNGEVHYKLFAPRGRGIVELESHVVLEDSQTTTPSLLFERVRKLYDHEILTPKKVLICGLGSGGCVVANYLGRTGIGSMSLLDHEILEEVNLIRHTAGYGDLYQPKIDAVFCQLREANPHLKLKKINLRICEKTVNQYSDLIEEHDLVVACTGHPLTNHLTNEICSEFQKPAVYAGVYPEAKGGFALQVIPQETCCYNCLYDLTKIAMSDSNEDLEDQRRRYGISEDQLSVHQGLFIDISFVALLQAKLGLLMLLGKGHSLGGPKGNLIIWDSVNCECKVIDAQKREDCRVCGQRKRKTTRLTVKRQKEPCLQFEKRFQPTESGS